MKQLPNKILIEAYRKAKELNLDQDFCKIIKTEINNRGLLSKVNNNSQDQNKKF